MVSFGFTEWFQTQKEFTALCKEMSLQQLNKRLQKFLYLSAIKRGSRSLTYTLKLQPFPLLMMALHNLTAFAPFRLFTVAKQVVKLMFITNNSTMQLIICSSLDTENYLRIILWLANLMKKTKKTNICFH